MGRKFKSWCFNFSTKEPVEGALQDYMVKWLSQFDYCYAVIEGGEGTDKKRHLHAQIWNDEGRDKDSLSKYWRRNLHKVAPESDVTSAVTSSKAMTIAYNNDFYLEYMEKDVTEVLLDKIPLNPEDYYPSEEEQLEAQQKSADSQFYQWSIDFKEWFEKHPLKHDKDRLFFNQYELLLKIKVSEFLSFKMFNEKKYRIIKEKRKRCEAAQNLFCYIIGKNCPQEFVSGEQWAEYNDLLEDFQKDGYPL